MTAETKQNKKIQRKKHTDTQKKKRIEKKRKEKHMFIDDLTSIMPCMGIIPNI